jgi:LysM repeat protein
MKTVKPLITAFLLAVTATGIVFGSFSATLFENQSALLTVQISPTQDQIVFLQTAGIPTLALSTQVIKLITVTSTVFIPSPASCPAPQNWMPYNIQPGDNLESLVIQFQTTIDAISKANCLESTYLMPDTIIFLPALNSTPTTTLTSSSTSSVCGPPDGWVKYTIQRNDTLFVLSVRYDVSVPDLQAANCLGTNTLLVTGQTIYVPFLIFASPTLTKTVIQEIQTAIQPANTKTSTTIPPTNTATSIPTPLATQIFTPLSTFTLVMPTPTHTATPAFSATTTQIPSSTLTNTPIPPSVTFTSTNIPGAISTPTPTLTLKP